MPKAALPVDINPAVLRWARETAGRSVDDAAQQLGKSVRAVSDWETGRKPPSWQALVEQGILGAPEMSDARYEDLQKFAARSPG